MRDNHATDVQLELHLAEGDKPHNFKSYNAMLQGPLTRRAGLLEGLTTFVRPCTHASLVRLRSRTTGIEKQTGESTVLVRCSVGLERISKSVHDICSIGTFRSHIKTHSFPSKLFRTGEQPALLTPWLLAGTELQRSIS